MANANEEKRELQSFLGFTNFYRKFIKNYSEGRKGAYRPYGTSSMEMDVRTGRGIRRAQTTNGEDVILAILNEDRPLHGRS